MIIFHSHYSGLRISFMHILAKQFVKSIVTKLKYLTIINNYQKIHTL